MAPSGKAPSAPKQAQPFKKAQTLRTRLLLSYGLLIGVLLTLFNAGATLAQLRNPLVYESAAQQLRTAQRIAAGREDFFETVGPENWQARARQAEERLAVRVALVQPDGTQLADSQSGLQPALRTLAVRVNALKQHNEIGFLRDETNRTWLALVQPAGDNLLVLAIRRPRLVLVEFFRSEFLRPVIFSGLLGLGLSVLISLVMAHWINAPLERIGAAADGVAAGRFAPIQPEGPAEVRRLAESFNRMVQRVQEAQQSQRDLVANVSHELKTPLTSIRGFTQAILDGVSSDPGAVRQAAQVIYTEANRMNRLVQDLLALARLEAGTAELQYTALDPAALIHGMVEKFRPQAEQAGLRLEVQAAALPWLMGDGDRLAQVLANLLDNAIKYTPAGGEIHVTGQAFPAREGANGVRTVHIRVADSGVGIQPSDRGRVFERFYQSDRSRAGMGLGLAISRQIVLAHGGTISVEDNPPHGCIFTVELPAGGEPPGMSSLPWQAG